MKKSNWLTWLLVAIPSLPTAASAVAKLAAIDAVVANMTRYGISEQVKLLGALELLIVALFVYPASRNIGFFLACSYMGGAMATHATHGEPIIATTILLALFWAAMVYQKPHLFWRNGASS